MFDLSAIVNHQLVGNLTVFKGMALLAYLLCGPISFAANSPNLTIIEQHLTGIDTPANKIDYITLQLSQVSHHPAEDKAQLLLHLAAAQEQDKQLEQAFQSYSQAINILSATPQSPLLVKGYLARSFMVYLQTNDYKQYCPDRIIAVELAHKQSDQALLADALTQTAFCFNQANNFDIGLMHLSEALDIAKEYQLSPDKLAKIFNATAAIYRDNHLHKQAEDYFQQAFNHWQQVDDKKNMFNMLHNLVGEAVTLTKWKRADGYLQQMSALIVQMKKNKDLPFFYYFNKGRYHLGRQEYSTAIQAFEMANDASKETEEAFFVTQSLGLWALGLFHYQDVATAGQVAERFLNSDGLNAQSASLIEQVRSIYFASEGEYFTALGYLFSAIEFEKHNMEDSMANDVVLVSLNHNVKVTRYENQLLEKELAINQLSLTNQIDKQRITKLSMFIFIVIAASLAVLVIFLIYSRRQFIRRAQTDFLTGIANRRFTFEEGRKRLQQCQENQKPFAVILFDIDHFKKINDQFGHDIGDKAIIAAVGRCQSYIKQTDIVGRVGGEEFLCILPNVDENEAMQIAERLRSVIAEKPFQFSDIALEFTISLGVAVVQDDAYSNWHQDSTEQHFTDLVKKADLAMYQAKNQGRNQVQLYR
ncbi:tetratricopeptide repeat-containing diguanylate cyclase [Shewanella sp. OMA3-2]|uniref:tetratricopeptide repeat-containing diguanylate cyclase n=1 Tax=Shewanella sp. OMA3-2 TaxID=2908650 RepID=UPI001F39C9DF|nr:tetratricopeptide repeat-containing diguanylate cyclase [Shewanella sp. OMA3-2]UJF21127.1 diguanylate cyclase [Shewanella sp. OMA3-2]